MQHTEKIKSFISVILSSDRFHMVVVVGPPGWAKTHSTREALNGVNTSYELIGAYTTPLALYNKMAENCSKVLVIDDSAGIFNSAQSLAILNAASWPGVDNSLDRIVKWNSTSELAVCDSFVFTGKLIVITNSLPESPQIAALLNRSFLYRISISSSEVSSLLRGAINRSLHFEDKTKALSVVEFLEAKAEELDMEKMSLRTLEQGYELATVAPDSWHELLFTLLPKKNSEKMSEKHFLSDLINSKLKVEEQVQRFCQRTGKSRRTFFYARAKYKNSLGDAGVR